MTEWKIIALKYIKEKSNKEKVIYWISYECAANHVDGNWQPSGVISDTLEFDTNNLDNFIEYNDLTEEQVIGWVKNKLGDTKVVEIEAQASAKLEEKLNPTSETVLIFPWSN